MKDSLTPEEKKVLKAIKKHGQFLKYKDGKFSYSEVLTIYEANIKSNPSYYSAVHKTKTEIKNDKNTPIWHCDEETLDTLSQKGLVVYSKDRLSCESKESFDRINYIPKMLKIITRFQSGMAVWFRDSSMMGKNDITNGKIIRVTITEIGGNYSYIIEVHFKRIDNFYHDDRLRDVNIILHHTDEEKTVFNSLEELQDWEKVHPVNED